LTGLASAVTLEKVFATTEVARLTVMLTVLQLMSMRCWRVLTVPMRLLQQTTLARKYIASVCCTIAREKTTERKNSL
jgi:hypothetical protein